MKRQSEEEEKVFADRIFDKELVSGIYKEILQKDKTLNLKTGEDLKHICKETRSRREDAPSN